MDVGTKYKQGDKNDRKLSPTQYPAGITNPASTDIGHQHGCITAQESEVEPMIVGLTTYSFDNQMHKFPELA